MWELYLFCYFHEEGLIISREHESPDFIISNANTSVAVEAVIAESKTPYFDIDVQRIPDDIDVEKATEDIFPLIYGSPLYSKLSHITKDGGLHYWQFEHQGKITNNTEQWESGLSAQRIQKALCDWQADALPGGYFRTTKPSADLQLILDAFRINGNLIIPTEPELRQMKYNFDNAV